MWKMGRTPAQEENVKGHAAKVTPQVIAIAGSGPLLWGPFLNPPASAAQSEAFHALLGFFCSFFVFFKWFYSPS